MKSPNNLKIQKQNILKKDSNENETKKIKEEVLPISSLTDEGIDKLIYKCMDLVEKTPLFPLVGSEDEEVLDEEGKKLAKELDATFQRTSAKESNGIDELFESIGKRLINPSINDNSNTSNKEETEKNIKIEKDKNGKKKEKKGGCC